MSREGTWIKPAVAIALFALLWAALVHHLTGYPSSPGGTTRLRVAFLVVGASAIARLLLAVLKMMRNGTPHPIARLRTAIPMAIRDQCLIIFAILIISLLLGSLTYLKAMIPAVLPFWADEPLAALDRLFGLDGQALAVTLKDWLPAIGLFYGFWHFVNIGGILWVIHWQGPARGRFIISYMLTWSLGMAAAFVFSSAGPLFTGRYDLSIAPESVQKPAMLLWANYQAQGSLLGSGISAFPSLHVGIATWFALALRHRGWPRLGCVYVASIYFCSIVLGWHYGADGAGGIVVALIAHRLSKRLTRPTSEEVQRALQPSHQEAYALPVPRE